MLLIVVMACKKTPESNEQSTHPYWIQVPANFPALPADVQLTEEAVALGRHLYYDNFAPLVIFRIKALPCLVRRYWPIVIWHGTEGFYGREM